MEISETSMTKAIMPLLLKGEMSLCPVYATIRKHRTNIRDSASEQAFATLTNLDRLILYRFNDYSSYTEYYTFDTLMFCEATDSGNGMYIFEMNFLTQKGETDIYMTVRGDYNKNLPHQAVNAKFMCNIINSKM